MQPELCDVGIVGYGPVSATLANLLSQQGRTVAIWEKEPAPYALPRAVHVDGEVMRVFQQVGIADALEPGLFVNLGMRFVDADQNLLIDWPRPQGIGPQGWCPSYRIHQPDLEEALRTALFSRAGVEVQQNVEVTAINDAADAVTVVTRDRATGAERDARCRYLVGGDGARSFVRDRIGAGLVDLRSNAQWLVIDVVMKRPVDSLSDWTVQLCDPARPTSIARGVGNRRRWEFMVMPGDGHQSADRTGARLGVIVTVDRAGGRGSRTHRGLSLQRCRCGPLAARSYPHCGRRGPSDSTVPGTRTLRRHPGCK